ncbi:cell envelope integrity protein CreD [Novilysobacter erysipheiresistens]|uniref:Cell envelope integrity protein CreD n=1 Tax=Novilysobacter erysipheiresistens TaxID=1749332 RepID=A0ABU7YWR5_9GAMM
MRLWMRIAMVLGLTLAILVPLTMVRGVVQERQDYRRQVVADIARSYAGPQTFAGPVLVVPYQEVVEVEEADRAGIVRTTRKTVSRQWTFFPKTLAVEGGLKPGIRRRNLHEVRVYEWHGSAKAAFEVAIPADPGTERGRRIGQPYLSYAISDVRGLRGPTLQVGQRTLEVEQGRAPGHVGGEGLHALLPPLPPLPPGQLHRVQTELRLVLAGTERFSLVPLGDQNRFSLTSSWPHPSFDGSSPRTRMIDADGFQAGWEIPGVASNAQQRWQSAKGDLAEDAATAIDRVSVSLIDPVDVYSKTDRATKYGLLFVLLTFIGFFIFELTKSLPIHPIQYGLVGLALAMFFLLLLSLSEHFPFGWSYLGAGIACIGLITFYLSAVLRSVMRALGFAAMLSTLYAALYGLLVSEDNALVLGAGLLFVVLAALMVVTRKVDWYQLGSRPNPSPARREPILSEP